ncbi:PTS fructose IIA subunit family protein [Oleiagrimonas sp. C23AA]|uniref:PTS sugar transporter subunit IIA n=1 Tax=Oleiagrimonas sp. C23AA TaxID=2719047 RepID=UPI0014229036|nr:PTS fructose IIA subunit family protein [Oleiagrimonas sp. C23AA]NII11516.1 PTS fructose IIA subunit family protein [Oleiagrimonas sp. C23AA]
MTLACESNDGNVPHAIGVILMTHEGVGKALITAARHVMPQLPLKVTAVEVPADADISQIVAATEHHVHELDTGGGVLVLSDLYGATPCNIGLSLGDRGNHVRCVSGLNLPMLLRVFNYADKPLDEIAEIAASGGRGGIFIDHA